MNVPSRKNPNNTQTKKNPQIFTYFLLMSFIKMMKEIRFFFKSVSCLEKSVEDNVSTGSLFQKAVVS